MVSDYNGAAIGTSASSQPFSDKLRRTFRRTGLRTTRRDSNSDSSDIPKPTAHDKTFVLDAIDGAAVIHEHSR